MVVVLLFLGKGKSVITKLKEIALRLWLYFYGVRFYHRDIPPNTKKAKEAEFRVDLGHVIKFNFYKEDLEDIILKRGKVFRERSVGYIIQAEIDNELPKSFKKYDQLCFFFNGWVNHLSFDEESTIKLLLDIYLDYIAATITSKEKE